MDADLSHDPRHLPALIAAAGQADVVIGSRYVPGGAIVNWPRRRRLLSRLANIYIRQITRLSARDCTSGYRCWRRDALAAMPLDRFISDGYSFLVEMLFVAAGQGCADRRSADHVRRAAAGRIEAVARGAARVGAHAVAAGRARPFVAAAARDAAPFSCYRLGAFRCQPTPHAHPRV